MVRFTKQYVRYAIILSMKVFILDPLWNDLVDDSLLSMLRAAGIDPQVESELKPLEEIDGLYESGEARLLCVNPDYVSWNLKSEAYASIPDLAGIMLISTGFDWVDMRAADEKAIPVCNIRDFSTDAVAEWAIMMMLTLARRVPMMVKDGFPLNFDSDYLSYRGMQLKGKTAGIIGLGNIGTAIADRCEGLGMNVVYYSRSQKETDFTAVGLKQLMSQSDVVFPTIAYNEDTKRLLHNDLLRTMKPSSIFVSVAHHELIDEPFVANLVASGKLYGYGFEAKPGTFSEYDDNVWAAPAYAWDTRESMYKSLQMLCENVVMASQGVFPNKVN